MRSGITRREFCSEVLATSILAAAGAAVPMFVDAKGVSRSKPFVGAEGLSRAKPFVKWAGGKGQLLSQLEELFPADLATRQDLTYVEPFVGGGAMLFYILSKYKNIKHALINDFNKDLIGVYKTVRDNVAELIPLLAELQAEYRSSTSEEERQDYYLSKRTLYNSRTSNIVETSALFIFLNRIGYNGLYRVNSKGLYNVPFGKAVNAQICDRETLLADSELLQGVEIISGDFEGIYGHINGKSFIYFDPPYRPLPGSPSFTAYSKDGFNDTQQERLARFCRKLDEDGHQWLLSNSDPSNTDKNDKFFDTLFDGFEIHRVIASRMINSKADGRGKITELAIRNYKE